MNPNCACGTCVYGDGWKMTKHKPPRINRNYMGHCSWVIPANVPMPLCMIDCHGKRLQIFLEERRRVYPLDTHCATWEGKP